MTTPVAPAAVNAYNDGVRRAQAGQSAAALAAFAIAAREAPAWPLPWEARGQLLFAAGDVAAAAASFEDAIARAPDSVHALGVPVVTRIGARHAERMSASILRHAGLGDLVAADDEAYVALAVRLATDLRWRAAMCLAVRTAFSRPALTDPIAYARALEDAYTRALSERHSTLT